MDDGGSPELLTDNARAPESWSSARQLVTYLTLISLPSSAEMGSRFSPDGRWLAYQANDSGTFEIYVEPFPRTGVRARIRFP